MKARRWARVLTRVAMVATVLGFTAWTFTMMQALSFQPVTFSTLRVSQVVQGLGLLGIVPAAVGVFDDIRRREGWGRYVGSTLVLPALVGSGSVAAMYGMVTGSMTF